MQKKMTKPESMALLLLAVICLVVWAVVFGGVPAPLNTQSLVAVAQAANSSTTPQRQIDAGAKQQFDVISVKQNNAARTPQNTNSNVPLGPMDDFTPTGGLLSATNIPLSQYIAFAYKLTEPQLQAIQSQLPKWANSNRYDIQAKASGNPNKDQMRLMTQALLAKRFKLALHYETRQVPVLALVLDKPGKLGPQLQLHPDRSPCSSVPASPGRDDQTFQPTVAGGFPEVCGVITMVQPSAPGRIRVGARGAPLSMFASLMNVGATGVGRPSSTRRGSLGKVDFVIEFTPELNGPVPPGATFHPDPNGPTFMEALKQQLGLKLESQTGPVNAIVIDHVEEPSAN